MNDIVLVGFGGHGKSVADCIERQGLYRIIGYTDLTEYADSPYPYLGTDDALEKLYEQGVRYAAVGIGYMGKGRIREQLYEKLTQRGFSLPVIVDPSAVVSPSAEIGEGTFVGKLAVVNAEATIGKMSIINTKALIEHECVVGDFTHVAVGAVLCGAVTVGNSCLVGANSTILQSCTLGNAVVVGAGSVVTKSLGDNTLFRHHYSRVIKTVDAGVLYE